LGNNRVITDEMKETAILLKEIPGGLDVLKLLQGSASFHDAEVIKLHLNREEPSTLVVKLATVDPIFVTFALGHWIDVEVAGFSQQNVIFGLSIRRTTERGAEPWEVGVGFAAGGAKSNWSPASARME
jgi:hypothetical protein